MGNVRHFRRIRKHDALFLNMCVFREHLVNVCVFRWNLVNYLENLQILPLGNVRLFRRIRKNDAPFLKTCVFFAEINIFHRILGGKGGNIAHLSKVPCAVVSKTKCAVCRCRGTTPLGPPRLFLYLGASMACALPSNIYKNRLTWNPTVCRNA